VFAMPIAHVVKSGDSQTIHLPKGFNLTTGEIEIFRRGDEIVLREHRSSAESIFDLLASFPDDFMAAGRVDAPPEKIKEQIEEIYIDRRR
jgi:antitoxin VapB